jgi:hypothetical protein
MATLFEELAGDVHELLAELGAMAQYVRYTQENDLVEGTSAVAPLLRQELPTARVPVSMLKSSDAPMDVRQASGTHATSEITHALCSTVGATFRPGPDDRVFLGTVEWNILDCTPINVDGQTDVIYLLRLVLP